MSLCIDAIDLHSQAQFWAQALGWNIDATGDEVFLVPTDGTSFGIVFERVTHQKSGQNRLHLDLTTVSTDDHTETIARLVSLGARHVDIGQGPDDRHVVLADPEGNEFCIIEPDNKFLDTCPRLGAVNCDGSQAVGYFWSKVLGWPLVWDQHEETAIRAPDLAGPMITWSGPPLMPKVGKNRLHFDIAPPVTSSQHTEVERLVALGATRVDIGQGDVDWVVMADPDGNEFCVLTPR